MNMIRFVMIFTMDLFARAIDAVMTEAGIERATLIGHSMGTQVIRQFSDNGRAGKFQQHRDCFPQKEQAGQMRPQKPIGL